MDESLLPCVSTEAFCTGGRQFGDHCQQPSNKQPLLRPPAESAVTNRQITSGLLVIREEHIKSSLPFIESRLRKVGHRSEPKPVKIVFRPISEWSEMF